MVSGSYDLKEICDDNGKSLAMPAAILATRMTPKVSDLASLVEIIRAPPSEEREQLRRPFGEDRL